MDQRSIAKSLECFSTLEVSVKPEETGGPTNVEDALFTDAKAELVELKNTVIKYQRKINPTVASSAPQDHVDCTWTEVRKEIEAAVNDPERRRIKMSCLRIVSSLADFSHWLDLLPNGDYGAIISGVFKIVIGAAARASDIQLAILSALEDIPDCVGRAAEYRELYRREKPQKLIEKSAQLCKAILIALRHIMLYMNESSLKGATKAILQGSNYKKTLQECLDRIKDLTSKMHLEATVCSQYRIQIIEESMRRLQREMQDVQVSMKNIQKDEERIIGITTRIGDILEEGVINGSYYRSPSQTILTSTTNNGLMAAETSEGGPLSGGSGERSPMLLGSHDPSLLSPSVQSLSGIDKATLLSQLGDLDSSNQDLQQCLDRGRLLTLVDQDRLKFMMRSSRLRAWLASSASRAFLINGNLPGNEVHSPTTMLAAQIVVGLRVLRPVVVLKFFCSMHIRGRDGVQDDAVRMMKSFISQLVSMDRLWNLASISQNDLDGMRTNDFEALCKVLYRLLRQLPEKTFAYCIVDGITFYERVERRQGFLNAINELLNIMDSCKNLIMKLLLTCHGRSQFVKRYVEDASVLLVPPEIDGEGQGWDRRKSLGIRLPEF